MNHDSLLWYNLDNWGKYGLAVPNFGRRTDSLNANIRTLVQMIGRHVQAIMWHTDAHQYGPPSVNTLERVHVCVTQVRRHLASRAIEPGQKNIEPKHASPAPEQYLIYPTPFFHAKQVHLKEYAELALLALTEAMQHTENDKAMEISTNFAAEIGQYFYRIYRRMCIDLLNVPEALVTPDFTLSDAQLYAYNPVGMGLTESNDARPATWEWPTEEQREVLKAIPAHLLVNLPRWQAGSNTGASSGTGTNPGNQQAATSFLQPSGFSATVRGA